MTRVASATIFFAYSVILLAPGRSASAEVRNPFLEQPGLQVLLAAPDVRATLKLTEAQAAAVDGVKTLEAKLKEISGDQRRQLRIIDAQREGGYVLTHERIVKFLSLNAEQREKVTAAVELNAAEHKKMKDFMARARFRSREAMDEYVAGFRGKADAKLMEVLNAQQQQKLKELFAAD